VWICRPRTAAVGLVWGVAAVVAAMDACGPGWVAGPCLRYSDCAVGYTCADGMCAPLPVSVPDGGVGDGSASGADTGEDAAKSDGGGSAKDAGHDARDGKSSIGDATAG
jgi:hypothetical protein